MELDKLSDTQPIFVVGAGRSGTTLLQMIINAHPNIAICGELHFFDQISQIRKELPNINSHGAIRQLFYKLQYVHDLRYLPNKKVLFKNTENLLKQSNSPTYEMLYKGLMVENAKLKSARRYGEKTPSNVRYLEKLINIFPNSKTICIVRDPRAVVASRVKVPFKSNSVLSHSVKWNIDIRCWLTFKSKFAKNTCELKYEDLIDNPLETVKKICKFIGEDFRENMLAYYKTSSKFLKNEPWKKNTLRPINKASLYKWKSDLNDQQVAIIDFLTYKYRKYYNYSNYNKDQIYSSNTIKECLKEVQMYLTYKRTEKHERDKKVIYGDNLTLFKLLFK